MRDDQAEQSDLGHSEAQSAEFDTGCLGCLFVLMVPIAIVFSIAAFNPEFADSLANSNTRRNIVGGLRVGPIDIGALLLASFGMWEAVKAARRFVDMRAVWIDGDMVRFHPTVRRHSLSLHALEGITHEAGDIKSILWLEHAGGKRIKVAMVDQHAARAFVAQVLQTKADLTFG